MVQIFEGSDSDEDLSNKSKGEMSKSLFCRSSELEAVNLEDF